MAEEEIKEEGFIGKVKDFIHDLGEKLEGTLGFGKPTASVSGFHIPFINLEKADIVIDITITNPNPVPIPLVDIDYLIESEGRKLISGLIPDAGTLAAHGSEVIKIPVTLIYKDIQDTYDDIKPGDVLPYRVKVDLIADVPIFGKLTLPLEKKGEIPIPYKPDVDLDKIEWDRLSLEETAATLHIKIENKNKFKLEVHEFDYDIILADVPIAKADLNKVSEIAEEGIGYLELPISFRPLDFGSALWGIIRGKGAGYSMKGRLKVITPFGTMDLPFSKEGGKTELQKKDGVEVEDDDDEAKEKHHHWFSRGCGEEEAS